MLSKEECLKTIQNYNELRKRAIDVGVLLGYEYGCHEDSIIVGFHGDSVTITWPTLGTHLVRQFTLNYLWTREEKILRRLP